MVIKSRAPLSLIYHRLHHFFGPQYWWPAQSPFEVIVGAILTQNTNWTNVERALHNLKSKRLLSSEVLHKLSVPQLASLIRPAGYFNVKARRLKNFLDFFLREFGGSVTRMKKVRVDVLRQKLLSVNGIGPETADSIILYALNKPVFVVDAYTKRILTRHNIISHDDDYHTVQQVFAKNLTGNAQLFNEYHALIVRLGKEYCKPMPACSACPLNFLNTQKRYNKLRYFPKG